LALETLYSEDPEVDDQWLDAFVIVDQEGTPVGRIEDGDAVLFFNFRGDRAIEISRAFEEEDLSALLVSIAREGGHLTRKGRSGGREKKNFPVMGYCVFRHSSSREGMERSLEKTIREAEAEGLFR
jgi:hypothetical protein